MKSVSNKQSGQAVIEYILVLLVVVSILGGVMWQFNDAFRKFSDSYFGSYLACLLELGELPALGGKSSGQCASEYQAFDLKNGRAPKASTAGGPPGGSDPNGPDEDSKDPNKDSSSSGSSDSASTGGGGNAEGGGRFGSNYSGSSREGRPASVVIGTTNDDAYTGSTDFSNGKAPRGSGARVVSVQLVDQSGGVIDPFETRKIRGAPVSVGKDTRSGELKSKKQKIDVNRKVASADENVDDSGMSFGDFLRWLLIAAVIIAIVFFLGGQALQIGKNWE